MFEKNGDLREDRQFFQAALADALYILTFYIYHYIYIIPLNIFFIFLYHWDICTCTSLGTKY